MIIAHNDSDDDVECRYFCRREAYSKPTPSSNLPSTSSTSDGPAGFFSTSPISTNTISGTAYIGYTRSLPIEVDDTHKSNNNNQFINEIKGISHHHTLKKMMVD